MKKLFIAVLTLILIIAIMSAFVQGTADVMKEQSVLERFETVDYAALGIEAELWDSLLEEAAKDARLVAVLENIELYPHDLLKLAATNRDARDFAAAYPEHMNEDVEPVDITLTATELNGSLPSFKQWDSRWGYALYGGSPLGLTGCGPTCLSMVTVALTGDGSCNPLELARFAEEKGYYVEGSGSSWDLMRDGAASLGLNWREVSLSEENMRAALDSGEYIICSMLPGDFTAYGHFIVIDGCKGGKFSVEDPNSIERSERRWSYDELKDQMAVIWAYSAMR